MIVLEEEKSITRAAERLFVTQPALSLFLTRLESSVGTPLFDRTKEGLIPTFAGKRYLETAKKIIALDRQFQQDLCEINTQLMGNIRVGTSAHIGSYALPSVVTEFNRIHPNINVEIIERNSGELERLIREKNIDVALMHLPFKNLHARYEKIFTDRYVMAFHKDSELNCHMYDKQDTYPYIDPVFAKNEQFILAFPYQRVRQISERILSHANIIPDIRFQTSSVQTSLQFVSKGLGVTFAPESYLSLFRYSDDIQFCYMEDIYEAYWIFCLVYPHETENSRPVEAFTHITKELFSR